MEIPDLVRQELGDEEVRGGVTLGDEDAACFTRTRTLVYRGEGLLSDERVDVYPHDFERLSVSEGRRKTKFTAVYVDEKLELTVPSARGDAVLERLLEGNLSASNVLADGESVSGVFRFSELTLVVTERQLLKHIGNATWDADFERYGFDDVTGLEFEEGSVATALVLSVDGRHERIKAPSEQAPSVRKALEESLFAFHGVGSLEELNAEVGAEPDDDGDREDGIGLESGIDPLVSGESDGTDDARADSDQSEADAESPSTESVLAEVVDDGSDFSESERPGPESAGPESPEVTEELTALREQVTELTAAVERQREQLQKQDRTIKQLIKELRQGR